MFCRKQENRQSDARKYKRKYQLGRWTKRSQSRPWPLITSVYQEVALAPCSASENKDQFASKTTALGTVTGQRSDKLRSTTKRRLLSAYEGLLGPHTMNVRYLKPRRKPPNHGSASSMMNDTGNFASGASQTCYRWRDHNARLSEIVSVRFRETKHDVNLRTPAISKSRREIR